MGSRFAKPRIRTVRATPQTARHLAHIVADMIVESESDSITMGKHTARAILICLQAMTSASGAQRSKEGG